MTKKVIMEEARREAMDNLRHVSSSLTVASQEAIHELISKVGKPAGWALLGVETNQHERMEQVTDLRSKGNSRDFWGFDYIVFSPTFVFTPNEAPIGDLEETVKLSVQEWDEVRAEEARTAAAARVAAAQRMLDAANAELASAEEELTKRQK